MVKSAVARERTSPSLSMQRKSIKKRKATLKKKAEELAILCDAEVCMVVSDGQAETIWPEDPATAKAIMTKYKESTKRSKQQVVVEKEEKKEELLWDEELEKLPVESLMDLYGALEAKLGSVDERIRLLEGKDHALELCDHHPLMLIPHDFDLDSQLDAMLKKYEENGHHHHDLPLGFEAADDNFGFLGFDANSINSNIKHDDQLVPNWEDVHPTMMGFNVADHHQCMAAPEILAQPSPSPLLEALPMAFWPQSLQSRITNCTPTAHSTAYQSF